MPHDQYKKKKKSAAAGSPADQTEGSAHLVRDSRALLSD